MSRSFHTRCTLALVILLAGFSFGPRDAAGQPVIPNPTLGTDILGEPEVLIGQPPAISSEGADDPPGLLTSDRLEPVTGLAARLSRDRTWLTEEVLEALDERALSIDEIFTDAPRLVAVDGVPYRVELEMVGELWDGFDPAQDPYVVFLTHEVFDGLGEDRAVGFEAGQEIILYQGDFQRLPALALTLAGTTAAERPDDPAAISELGAVPIPLGEARPEVEFRPGGIALETSTPRLTTKTHCDPDVAPTSCSGSTLVCPSGYTPYFLLTELRIFDDLEECCFKGAPEVELYSLRVDSSSPAGGSTSVTTDWIFDGRYVTDLEGRTRYLPDVDDDNHQWYTISGGLALFPTNTGSEWSATLVEDDDTKGELKLDMNTINWTKLLDTGLQVYDDAREMEYFELLVGLVELIDIIGLFDGSDRLFQQSLGVTNDLFCSEALGSSHPRVFTLSSSSEWEAKGYFACLNNDCSDGGGGGGGGGGGDEEFE